MIVVDVARLDTFEMVLAYNNHTIETRAAYEADKPFGMRILPRRTWRGRDFFDPEHGGLPTKDPTANGIPITQQVVERFI